MTVAMMYSLPIEQPNDPVSMNWVKSHSYARRGGFQIVKALAPWKVAAYEYWWKTGRYSPAAELTNVPCNVRVTLSFTTRRQRDPHNYTSTVVKSLIDGLVTAHLWPDDNPQYVTVIEPVLRVVQADPRLPLLAFIELSART